MTNAKDIEELRFSYGDPRPTTAWYAMQQLQDITCYHLKKRTLLLGNTNVMVCKCDGVKRQFKIPETKAFMKGLQNPRGYKIVLIPIKVYNKSRCRQKSSAKHMIYLIYNTITHELVRFDMRRDQVSGFEIKRVIKMIKKRFLPVIQTVDENAVMHPELEVTAAFAKKVDKSATLRDAFPIFSICYLNIVSQNPELTVKEAVSKTKSLSSKAIEDIWNRYVQWYTNCETIVEGKCKDTQAFNPENSKCMSFMSKSYTSHLIEKPSKPCEDDLVFDRLAEKCVLPSKLKAIDIFLGDVEEIKINKKTKFKFLGDFKYGMGALSMMMSKFPYSKLISPANCSSDDSRINWIKDKTTGEFSFHMSDKMWDIWDDAMVDPSLRFLVVLVSLKLPHIGHANVLIYDKSSNELERFDPHGYDELEVLGHDKLDVILKETWNKHLDESNIKMKRKFRFFSPKQYCPRKAYVFQAKESEDLFVSNSDSKGNCAVWRMWYIHVRLSNPNLNRKEVVLFASKKLNENGSVRNFIKMYQKYVAMLVARDKKADPVCKEDEVINPLTKRCVKNTSKLGKKLLAKAD